MTEPDPAQDLIKHFGTKGMKWGVRNSSSGSAASKLSTNAKTNGKDPYPRLSTKKAGHAGDKLSTSSRKPGDRPKLGVLAKSLDRRDRSKAERKLAKLSEQYLAEKAKPDSFSQRRKLKKIKRETSEALLIMSIGKRAETLYVTVNGVAYRTTAKKWLKQQMRNPVPVQAIQDISYG